MDLPSVSGEAKAESLVKQQPEQDEIRKYIRLLPQAAEPNLARVREVKEQIANGTYLTPEVIEETAARLVFRFLRKE